jgi:hypothetical protein
MFRSVEIGQSLGGDTSGGHRSAQAAQRLRGSCVSAAELCPVHSGSCVRRVSSQQTPRFEQLTKAGPGPTKGRGPTHLNKPEPQLHRQWHTSCLDSEANGGGGGGGIQASRWRLLALSHVLTQRHVMEGGCHGLGATVQRACARDALASIS